MPKKGKAKKGKGKAKGKAKGAIEKEDILKKTKELLKIYPACCSSENSSSGAILVSSLKRCVEEEKPLIKAVLDPQRAISSSRRKVGKQATHSKDTVPAIAPETTQDNPVTIFPMLQSLSEIKYTYLRCIHIWHLLIDEMQMAKLSLFMEGEIGHGIRVLELIDNNISTWSLCRLSRTFLKSQLVSITLDYNSITDEGIHCLCTNLMENLHLNSLNLNYCGLPSSCGEKLGLLASSTQLRHLGIRGNRLQSQGMRLLLQNLVTVSETNPSMPLLERLFIQDNEIDGCGGDGLFAPVACMEMMKRWLSSCKAIEEVRLDGNLIGDSAAREIFLGLQYRKEVGFSPIQLSLTNCISTNLFTSMKDLTPVKGKKGKSKKKRKKKKS